MNLRNENKSKLVEKVFNEVYDKYDLMNDIMSLGTQENGKNLVYWLNPLKIKELLMLLLAQVIWLGLLRA